MDSRNKFLTAIGILASLVALMLGYDLWEIVTGQVDVNQHIPFVLPFVPAALAGMMLYAYCRSTEETPTV